MYNSNFYIPDLVEIQRQGFFHLLEKGIIEEIRKHNPITCVEKQIEIYFYPKHYRLTKPLYSIQQAIFYKKSYVSKLYVPVQVTDRKNKRVFLKWMLLAHFPLMTNRGHFVLNGSPRVIINQLVRSPGIYFRENIHEIYSSKWSAKPTTSFRRHYADIICLKGTWLRIECDKDFSMWAKMKKGPKMPLLWFLLGMGLSEKYILNFVSKPMYLLESFTKEMEKINKSKSSKELKYPYVSNSRQAWEQIQKLFKLKKTLRKSPFLKKDIHSLQKQNENKNSFFDKKMNIFKFTKKNFFAKEVGFFAYSNKTFSSKSKQNKILKKFSIKENSKKTFSFDNTTSMKQLAHKKFLNKPTKLTTAVKKKRKKFSKENFEKRVASKLSSYELGRKWFSNKFMNPKTYDLGKQGRLSMNKKLGLTLPIQQTTLTALDVLTATDCLMKIEDGFLEIDDIDHLKNKRVRTAGESIQEILSIGLVRLEKAIRLKLNGNNKQSLVQQNSVNFLSLVNTRPINGAFREFFGTHPLSQFMDQINPLAEITHKRRLTSLGPGGVSRDTATLAIRGIHPSHYGRICPIETPEGKNTGLVNSITTYAKISFQGFLCSPFHKVYKRQIQKNEGVFFLTPDQEEYFKTATPDLNVTLLGFLPKKSIPVRIGKRFVRMKSKKLSLIGVSPLQMISVATSFIPFLEHDDANRALMGSNMQRQAVPLIRPERPYLGTGLEARVVSDSGHALVSKMSGYVILSSGSKISLYTFF
uniref:RNA polymerase beta subunit b a n=1 Tax=Coelastrella saipanensis TaxID=152631 RepID=UPI0010C50362|nr:RNA polymerase beta subunit b a [Coelastrella saipanensis]AVV61544.1 RNA polymerase beta subunit b a [Coelastrella saipanensis]